MLLDNQSTPDALALLEKLGEAMAREAERSTPEKPEAAPPVAALFDFSQRLLRAPSRLTFFRTLAEGLKELVGCDTAVAAEVRGERCRVEAVSQIDSVNPHAELVLEYEAACSQALADSSSKMGADGFLRFVGADGNAIVVVLLKGASASTAPANSSSSDLICETLSSTIETKLTALKRSRLQQWREAVSRAWRIDRRTAIIAACIAAGVALIPWPYWVRCHCEVEPFVRRHVVAPFDGVFQQSLCKPGDVVTAGQTLGRLDAKEVNWELAGVKADRDRAIKSRDVNLAAGKTALAQIDRLESQRLDERRKLLENRLANLEVKSPIAGVVVAGELDRAEGAPVKIGQSLFEVAPLDQMVVEVLVPETDVECVRQGQPLTLSLESYLGSSLAGDVSRIYPRAEIRDDANVFVVETTLNNAQGELRPGMKGKASIRTDRRPLAWIVFHRIVESFYRWMG